MNTPINNEEILNIENKYPSKKETLLKNKRAKKKTYNILSNIKNPPISHFNIDSHFIFSEKDFIDYFKKIHNKNFIKLNSDELSFLSEKIDEIKILTNINEINDFILIDEKIGNLLKNFKPISNKEDEVTEFIENKIINSKNRADISCRKLSSLYLQEKGKFVCKSTINKIIKNKLNYHYIKTCKKSNFLQTHLGIFSSLGFIKLVIKSLKIGYDLIYVDESTIKFNNNNYKCWRKYWEQIYFGQNNKGKINLLLAVSKDEIIHYELTNQNTNSEIFLNYIKNLNKKLKKDESKKYIIIMDNCTIHKCDELIKYYKDEKINVIFNVKYCSYFNGVELCFRAIKKRLANKVIETQESLITELNLIFEDKKIKETLIKNYKETLEQYKRYAQEKIEENLNNFEIEI